MPGKNLALAGNFNLVNTDELFDLINMSPGDFQKQSDLAAMMEVLHHFLTKEDALQPNAAEVKKYWRKLPHYLMAVIPLVVCWVMDRVL